MTIDATVGGPDSNSYVTIADADAYFAQRQNAAWAALDDTTKEAKLIEAMDYLDATFCDSWKGYRVTLTQALSWPRWRVEIDGNLLPTDSIPRGITAAQMELAVRAIAGPLVPDVEQVVQAEQVDVLRVEYAPGSVPGLRYAFVSRLLAPYTNGAISSGNFAQAGLLRS